MTAVSDFRISALHKPFCTVLLATLLSASVAGADRLAPALEEPESTPVARADSIATESLSVRAESSPPKKNYLRTAILEAMALAGGTAWYWLDRERQVADWDFPSLAERLSLDVIRYDNNPHHVNFAWHAANGMSFHFMARINGLSFAESVAAGALTSLAWEYALEYREKVSFNDLMFTTGSGIPLGEFVHVFGRFLNEDPEAASFAPARWTAGIPAALMRTLDGAPPASLSTRPDFWHELHLAYDLSAANVSLDGQEDEHALHALHFNGRFVRLPGYLQTGVWQRFFRGAEFTEGVGNLGFGGKGDVTRVFADTVLLGWYRQSYLEDRDKLSNATLLGVSMAYRYRREQAGIWDDRVGVLHFPGLAAELNLRLGDFSFEGRARLHADFAGVNALSNEAWEAAHPGPDEQGKSILRKQGYYYGFGASAGISATLRYRELSLGGRLWAARYSSDEGLDRIQEDLDLDQASSDRIRDTELWLRWQGLPFHSYVGAAFSRRQRKAKFEEFDARADLDRFTLQLGLAL